MEATEVLVIDDSARVGRIASPAPATSAPLRRLALAVAIAFGVGATALPVGPALAAGLGRLVVQSAVGQPLRAEIEITSLAPDEADSLVARIPGADAFRRAGVEPSPALVGVRVSVERRADGHSVVRLVSAAPLQEPFVDLLVELAWSGGRLQREYTFLLDPSDPRSAAAARGEAVVPTQAGATATVPGGAAASPAAAAPPGSPAVVPPGLSHGGPPASPAAAAGARPGGHYDVVGGESLADIAQGMRPEGATVVQVMVAIYRANPAAFAGSMHHLLKGSRLRLPTPGEIAQVDVRQARRELRLQTADFLGERARLAAEPRVLDTAPAGRSASGAIGARIDEGARAEAQDRLRLSRAGDEAARGAGGRVGERSGAGAGSAERDVARDAAISELTERLGLLEKNVLNLQKLLELRDRQLAELQGLFERAREAGRQVTGSVGATPSVQGAGAADPGTSPAPAAPAAQPTGSAAGAPAADTAGDDKALAASGGPKVPAATPAPAAPSSGVPGWLLPALGAAALSIGAGVLMVLRRRRQAAGIDDWSEDDDVDAAGVVPGASAAGPGAEPAPFDRNDRHDRHDVQLAIPTVRAPSAPSTVDPDSSDGRVAGDTTGEDAAGDGPDARRGGRAGDARNRLAAGGHEGPGSSAAVPGPELFDSVPDLSGFAGLGGPRETGRTPAWLDPDLPDDAPTPSPGRTADGARSDDARSARGPVLPPLDLGGIDLSLPAAPATSPDSADATADSARWQDMASKLDLAAAYEEIGDRDGARELLEEVLAGGLPSQQRRASERLGQLRG